ncbi:AlpA family transcriptional regulator [Paracoccus sp. PAR01]|uniref:helix-turn-helix transcriptional regulator n=1 Tax=Paracoccus sp. PAR01 TaxID=2769282 RepID=UPI001780C446|nr:AlpA family phage regulatory protein [Paracoccus sp. PAR01]MBD9529843.1 AlpA family phage regulatory protein [Paracoccus sp. PAR01]
MLDDAKLISRGEVLHVLNIKNTLLYEMVKRGEFPAPLKIGRRSAWLEREVLAWVNARAAERAA